jgi:hypothetical protein
MGDVKLSAVLPDIAYSGMDRIYAALVRKPETRHVIIAVIDCSSTKVDHGSNGDTYTPTAGVLFVEPISDADDVNTIIEVMGRTRAERIDDATLDFDFGVGDPFGAAAQNIRDNVTEVTFNGKTIFGGSDAG